MKKNKKIKLYTPHVDLQTSTDGQLFVSALQELCEHTAIHDDRVLENAVKDIFKDVLAKNVKRLLTGSYPMRVNLKKYEAIFLYKHSNMQGYMQYFTPFLHEIHQNLIA
jgi:hypothetical protein